MRYICGPFVALAALSSFAAEAQSFDCKATSTVVEKAICNDKFVSDMDVALAQEYREALAHNRAKRSDIVSGQRKWLAFREEHCSAYVNDFGKLDDCLRDIYGRRMAAISAGQYISADEPTRPGVLCDSWNDFVFVPDAPNESNDEWPPKAAVKQECSLRDGPSIVIRYERQLITNTDTAAVLAPEKSTVTLWVNGRKMVGGASTFEWANDQHTYDEVTKIKVDAHNFTICGVREQVHGDDEEETIGPEHCSTERVPTRPHSK